jgi:flavin reductase (DIM6/NTAB) family NADH-FMN oxidoreductase RutF
MDTPNASNSSNSSSGPPPPTDLPSSSSKTLFYRPTVDPSPLPYDPFKACVVPRPIGWISTINPSTGSSNLAPYSQFNNLTYDPPYVMFAANQTPVSVRKDSVANAEAAGYFGWNLATWDLREAVNASAEWVGPEVDEFKHAGLEKEWGTIYEKLPLVKASPVRFECVYHSTLRLPGNPPMGTVDVVIGRVVGVHIADWAVTDGKLDVRKTMPIARLGYFEYTVVREVFEMIIPGTDKAMAAGMEGSVKKSRELVGEQNGLEKELDASTKCGEAETVVAKK